jgi:hypothetical protein
MNVRGRCGNRLSQGKWGYHVGISEKRFRTAVSAWFCRNFGAPTEVQALAWPAIQTGRNTLISAPARSGKTLAAFLEDIDTLVLNEYRVRSFNQAFVILLLRSMVVHRAPHIRLWREVTRHIHLGEKRAPFR